MVPCPKTRGIKLRDMEICSSQSYIKSIGVLPNYWGSLISDKNALHAGSMVTMDMGVWMVLTDL